MGYIGVITHLLTIDPNFLGHPSAISNQFPTPPTIEPKLCQPWSVGSPGPKISNSSWVAVNDVDGSDIGLNHQLSHEKTRGPLLSIESWLVNRDPYIGLL